MCKKQWKSPEEYILISKGHLVTLWHIDAAKALEQEYAPAARSVRMNVFVQSDQEEKFCW